MKPLNVPSNADAPDDMQQLAQAIDTAINGYGPNREVGFILLAFPFNAGQGARCNFVSNGALREDAIALMREVADRLESKLHPAGHA